MADKIGVVAFAFGVPSTIESNERISEIASAIARELKAKGVYTQTDVVIEKGIAVWQIEEKSGSKPPPTLRIAREAVRWANLFDLNKLYVVAAKPHYWRAVRDLKRAVRERKAKIEVCQVSRINQYPEGSWFCSDSTQERTQSRTNWEKRERILRHTPFWIYKLIAS
ncbi:MAG: hypothetical protein Q8L36_01285 [bacterium]|nr:hypothetical protein [bacterium]